jgi:hypothetical protein
MTLSIAIMLSVMFYLLYAECRYAECRGACHSDCLQMSDKGGSV